MDNKKMYKFRLWKMAIFCGVLFSGLLLNQFLDSAYAITHWTNGSGSSNWITVDGSQYQGEVWQLMTTAQITDVTLGYYTASGGSNTTRISLFDMAGNQLASSDIVWTPQTFTNTTQNFVLNWSNIFPTGMYYLGFKTISGNGFGWRYGATDITPAYYTSYSGSGSLNPLGTGSDNYLTINGTAGGANVSLTYPANNSTTTVFTVFKENTFVPTSGSFTIEINTAVGSESNLNDCAGYNISSVCYRLTEQIQSNNQKIHTDYETRTSGMRSFWQENNYYYSQINILQNGVVIASSTPNLYFITSTSLTDNSAYPNNNQPLYNQIGTTADSLNPPDTADYSSCNATSTFSATTLISEGFCYLGKWSENFFLQPSQDSDQIFKTAVENIKKAFPFSIIYGIIDPTTEAIETESSETATALTFNFKNGSGVEQNIPFLNENTLSDAVGSETKNTIFTILEYVIWIGAGWTILGFII